MKKLATLFVLVAFTVSAFGQLERMIDFEEGYADTAWNVFANGKPFGAPSDSDIIVVLNPLIDEVNPSDSVLSFYVRPESDRWVGMYTDYDVLTEFTEENHTLAMMVYKEMESRMGLKVEKSLTNSDDLSVYVPNTRTEEWELIIFDFTIAIGHYFQRLTMFPDFPETAEEPRDYLPTTVYIDNIGVPSEDNTSVKESNGIEMMLYPTPAEYRMAVVYPGMSGITLSDIMGRQIRTLNFPITDSKVIETGDLSTGIYFVTADTRDGRITMRFMKK
jgi:hypothetical protein